MNELIFVKSQTPKFTISYQKEAQVKADISSSSAISSIKQILVKKNLDVQVLITKSGILCDHSCLSLGELLKIISPFYNKTNVSLRIEVDFQKMLEAGGIHYFLATQLQTLSKYLQIYSLTIVLSEQHFNSKCLDSLASKFDSLNDLKRFELNSLAPLDQTNFLNFLPPQLQQLALSLNGLEQPKIFFNQIAKFLILNDLNLTFTQCNASTQFEFTNFIKLFQKNSNSMSTQTVNLSVMLVFEDTFLTDSEKLFSSLQEFLSVIASSSNKSIMLKKYSINVINLPESGLILNVLEELSKPSIQANLVHFSFSAKFLSLPKTILISILYKLNGLISKALMLRTLTLGIEIPIKYFDIIEPSLSLALGRLEQFEYGLEEQQRKKQPVLEINQECKVSPLRIIRGIKVESKGMLDKLRYLTENSGCVELKKYYFQKRSIILQIAAAQNADIFKRKEIMLAMLQFVL